MATRRVFTPRPAAMAGFCAAARVSRPWRVRRISSQVNAASVQATPISTRLYSDME